ncbi:hypothetical protein PISMIDRAFT_171787 [Pisolithus microcarpus 441]|uniref:Uncharacterized protein n=1 Tax=Pisolithus microcarpus 441 TaxID=765257 RepID=A0A0C9Z957_9AGAM|nr:hypothetical protein PISMIDRAFT_171787 [Pisolithus microcarpus 441]
MMTSNIPCISSRTMHPCGVDPLPFLILITSRSARYLPLLPWPLAECVLLTERIWSDVNGQDIHNLARDLHVFVPELLRANPIRSLSIHIGMFIRVVTHAYGQWSLHELKSRDKDRSPFAISASDCFNEGVGSKHHAEV